MVKVLIYGSKELYDKSSYQGRAEAHVIAYRTNEHLYQVVKNRNFTTSFIWTDNVDLLLHGKVTHFKLRHHIERLELDEWEADLKAHELQQKYGNPPLIELCKNE